jgi:hypothetical protein
VPYVQEGIAEEEKKRRKERGVKVIESLGRRFTAFRTTQALAKSLKPKVLV